MTFKELKEWLDCLTPDQLESTVMAYGPLINQATAVSLGFNSVEQMEQPLKSVKAGYPLLLLDQKKLTR